MSDFSENEIRMAELSKSLSHPARIKILKFLIEKDACVCGDIVKELPLAQSTVSQHLKELKKSGLIQGEVDGPKVCYCINQTVMQETIQLFTELFSEISPIHGKLI